MDKTFIICRRLGKKTAIKRIGDILGICPIIINYKKRGMKKCIA